jgi:hypothetical protein
MLNLRLLVVIGMMALTAALNAGDNSSPLPMSGVAKATNIAIHAYTEPEIAGLWKSQKVKIRIGDLVEARNRFSSYCSKHENEDGFWPFDSPLWHRVDGIEQKIFDDTTPEGDCAVVQAFAYLYDASGAEDTECAVCKRGIRMLPILRYALLHEINISGKYANARCVNKCSEFITEHPSFKGCDF